MKFAKIALIIIWLLLITVQIFPPFSGVANGAILLFKLLVVVHFVEFFFYLPLFNKIKGSLLNHFIQVMIFGALYYWQVRNENRDII